MRGTLKGTSNPAIRRALAAMLTLAAILAIGVGASGCGGKSSSTSTTTSTSTSHKQPSHAPGY